MKRMISLLLSVCMLFSFVMPVWAEEGEASGTCGDNLTWKFDEETGTLTISGTGEMTDYDGKEAPPWWYEYHEEVRKIVIGEGVTSIGVSAFWRCENLTEINFPDSLQSIGAWAFSDSAITEIHLSGSLEEIGYGAFFDCRSLKTVEIDSPAEGLVLDVQAFAGCANLATVKLPDGLKEIGEGAFACGEDPEGNVYACESLTSITLPEGVEIIGEAAFEGSGLTSITIPGSVKEIARTAFYECKNLKTVVIEEGVETMGEGVFNGCTALESVEFPSSLESIGNNAFFDCESLTEITLPEGVKSIGESAFNGCTSLETVVIPASVTSIGDAAFYCFDDEGNSTSSLRQILYCGTEEQWETLKGNVENEDTHTGIDWENVEVEYNYQPTVVEPVAPAKPAQSGGSGGDDSTALLLAGGAVAAAAGIYFYTHPDVLPAAVQKVKDFAQEVSACVQDKVQALSDSVRGAGEKWIPVADDDDEQDAQEQPAA